MGTGPGPEAGPGAVARSGGALVAALAIAVGPTAAAADPVLALPPWREGVLIDPPHADPGAGPSAGAAAAGATGTGGPVGTGWLATHDRRDDGELPLLALVAEFSGLGVVGADRIASFPHVGPIDGGEPALAVMRVGLVGRHATWPLAFALRADLAEADRLDADQVRARPLAAGGRLLDDALVVWTVRQELAVWLGRQAVPFSRFRLIEHGRQLAGAVPFVVDRVAPERRWGATATGDLGQVGYAVGLHADTARLERLPAVASGEDEPPGPPDRLAVDPSDRGRLGLAAHVEWTPGASVGRDHLPSPEDDPLRPVTRLSLGLGALTRLRADGTARADGALSALVVSGPVAAAGELLVAAERGGPALGAAIEVSLLPIDRALAFVRAEYDGGVAAWSSGAGATWFVTADRLNKVTLYGFVRRETDEAALDRDGIVVQLQAWL
jgi:hypothetical protein